MLTWGLPIESLTLSTIEGKGTPVTFKIVEDTATILPAKDSFLSCFNTQSAAALNHNYYVVDTSQQYRIIPDTLKN